MGVREAGRAAFTLKPTDGTVVRREARGVGADSGIPGLSVKGRDRCLMLADGLLGHWGS